MTVLAMAGDGGTSDIGIQALSGAAERNDDFIYVCYDNEAYMNTGTQRSGLTPAGARTTTTPKFGKTENPKDMPRIMEAHGVPYVASTSAAFPADVYDKVVKARGIHGTRYIHMNTPCPSGWSFDPKDTVAIGKLAVDAGIVVLLRGRGRRVPPDGAQRVAGEERQARAGRGLRRDAGPLPRHGRRDRGDRAGVGRQALGRLRRARRGRLRGAVGVARWTTACRHACRRAGRGTCARVS